MAKGQLISYSSTEPIKRTVTDRIIMADPMTIVAINALGLSNESKFSFVNVPGVKYEWLEDTFGTLTTGVNTTALTSDSTLTTVTVTSGAIFQVGDVIEIDAELMNITAISTNDLEVTRIFGGTQATHTNTATVTLRSRARVEGASAVDSVWQEPTTGYNYSQIFQKTIEVARSNQLLNRYGIPDVARREVDKAMDQLMMFLNKMTYYGGRQAGGASSARGAGALEAFIGTNKTNHGSAALTQMAMEDEIQDCWDAGGNPTLILCGGWVKRKIADFFSPYVRTEIDETRGGITIDRISSPLGIDLTVAVDRHCPTDTMYFLDPRYVGYITIDPFFEEELGKSKDTKYFGQVVGEYGFVVAYQKAHSFLYGISTSA